MAVHFQNNLTPMSASKSNPELRIIGSKELLGRVFIEFTDPNKENFENHHPHKIVSWLENTDASPNHIIGPVILDLDKDETLSVEGIVRTSLFFRDKYFHPGTTSSNAKHIDFAIGFESIMRLVKRDV